MEEIQAIIEGVARAAGESASALQRAGIVVGLEDFRVEVHVDPLDVAPSVLVTLVLGSGAVRQSPS